jgi:hypothetical protein
VCGQSDDHASERVGRVHRDGDAFMVRSEVAAVTDRST